MKKVEIFFQGINKTIVFRIGDNAEENFAIIDSSTPNDIWFHIDNCPSAHVVATIPEKMARKNLNSIIRRGALICKQYSKYNKMKDVNIVYAKISSVVKTEMIGKVELLESKTIII